MNRSSNLLNGALLGSSGSPNKLYIYATQWCQAQATALLRMGRQLHTQANVVVAPSFLLRAGRKLKSATLASNSIAVRLTGFVAVSLVSSGQGRVITTSSLKAMRAKTLQVLFTPRVYTVTKLQGAYAKTLQFVATLSVLTTVAIKRVHPEHLSSNNTLVATTQCAVNAGKFLKASCVLIASTSAVLSESSKVRAPLSRTAYLPVHSRVVFISGMQ